MNKTKVSVIVPVYNTERYLDKCLNCLISQTLKDIEIICVDDGSTDGSLKILENYAKKDSRIRILTQNHKKQGAARNYGIREARGEYIGFADSDDWCEAEMFEKLYFKAIETNSDITMCAISVYNDNTCELTKSDTYRNLEIFPEKYFNSAFSPDETLDFFFDICANPFNKIYRREFLVSNSLKFDENVYFEDIPFFFDVWFSADRISLVKDFLYIYRMFAQNSTCYSNDFNKIDNIKTFKSRERALKKHGVYKELKNNFKKYKRKSFLLWFDKIQNKRAKIFYFLYMSVNMPSCALEPLKICLKELNLYFKIILNSHKRIVFWGASIFLEKFLKKYKIRNKNIIGIIDKNPLKQGLKIGQYDIFAPEKLEELKAEKIIITVINFSESNRKNIKKFVNECGLKNTKLESV